MKIFKINENDEGQRLNKFIEKVFNCLPKSLIYKFIRKKNIKLNGKKVLLSNILKKGDVVSVFGLDSFFKENKSSVFKNLQNFKLDVIFEDENILVINKKEGIMSQPNSKIKNSLIDYVLKYLIEKKEYVVENENSFTPAFCTRLDTNTKGLIIAGKNAKAVRSLNELNRMLKIKKTYYCIVEGIVEKNKKTLKGFWRKDFKKNKVEISPNFEKFSKEVVTKFYVLKRFSNKTALKVVISGGKSHQIRAHMKTIGHPIVGDLKYGSKIKEQLKLVCCGLQFNSKNTYLDYLDGKEIILKKYYFMFN